MAYWLTTHWPLRKDEPEDQAQSGIWMRDEKRKVISQVQAGVLVFIYETVAGKTKLSKMADGRKEQVPCHKGRGGVVALVKVAKPASEPKGTLPESYSDGTTMWWRWYAPTEPVNTVGFVPRKEVARLLGYKPQYTFKGFGADNSGLGRLTEDKFKALLSAYTSKTIEKDETAVQHSGKLTHFGPGGEGPEHQGN